MITVIEHGNKKRYPQFCDKCGCMFEVHIEDTRTGWLFDDVECRVVSCPECKSIVKCENIKEECEDVKEE